MFGCSCNCGAELRTALNQCGCCSFGVIAQVEYRFGLLALIGLFSGFNENRLNRGPVRGAHGEDARAGSIRLGSGNAPPDPAGKLLGSVTGLARLTEPVVDLHPHCSNGSQEPQNLGVSGSQNIHPLLPGGIIDNSRGESPENRGRTSQNQADVDAVFIVCFGPQIKQPSGTHGSGNRCLGASQSRGHFKIKLSPQAHVGTRTAHEPQHNPGRDQHRTVGEVSRNRVRFIQSVISKLAIRRQPGCAHVGFVLGFLDFAGEKLRHPRIPDVGKELPRNRQSCCGGKGTGEIHLHPALFS